MSQNKNMKTTVQEGSTAEHAHLRQVFEGDATEATNISKRIIIPKIINKRKYWLFFTVKTIIKHSTYSYISVHIFTHTYYMHNISHRFRNVVESVTASLSTLSALYCPSNLSFQQKPTCVHKDDGTTPTNIFW
jgi:hypothetical protein